MAVGHNSRRGKVERSCVRVKKDVVGNDIDHIGNKHVMASKSYYLLYTALYAKWRFRYGRA